MLRKFVSSNTSDPSDGVDLKPPDFSFASTVYGGPNGILSQLLELKAWFEVQTIFHFYSCSVLMVYEKEVAVQERGMGAAVKLIDFAHVVEGDAVIDQNFLGGLCSLIKFISEILATHDEHSGLRIEGREEELTKLIEDIEREKAEAADKAVEEAERTKGSTREADRLFGNKEPEDQSIDSTQNFADAIVDATTIKDETANALS